MLLKRFPNLDKEALQAKYPDVNIQKLKFNKKTRGSHEFNTVWILGPRCVDELIK